MMQADISGLTIKVQNSSPFTTYRDHLPEFNTSYNKSPNKSADVSKLSNMFGKDDVV